MDIQLLLMQSSYFHTMKKKKVVFLGGKPIGGLCFRYLIEQCGVLPFEIMGLRTQERKEFGETYDLAAVAVKAGIPLLASLDEIPECDIIYSVQHHEILQAVHINRARQIAVNLHMAPLPEYRGCNQFSFAIIDGKAEFGTTVHRMDTRIDHGDILFQKRFPIPENCWVGELYDLTAQASFRLFTQTWASILSGNFTPVPQADWIPQHGASLHLRHEINDLKKIDLNWDAPKIERHIRATSMPGFEPPYCIINHQKVYFTTSYAQD
jgi:methionyl-tRNA formyltransferase